jgi:hypothetical protein
LFSILLEDFPLILKFHHFKLNIHKIASLLKVTIFPNEFLSAHSKSRFDFHQNGFYFAWQRSTLPEPCGSSTIDAGEPNGRVRDGNAWFPSAIITKQ